MLPPTIPTSFVPHASAAGARSGPVKGVLSLLAFGALAVAVALTVAVFLYDRMLAGQLAAKDAALAKAEASIDSSVLGNFARLHDRLTQGGQLLNAHLEVSNFLVLLSTILPKTARFSNLEVKIGDMGDISLTGQGVAKNFNALAATSNAFAADGRIKDAIFSHIQVDPKNNSVTFQLMATLNPKLIAYGIATTSAPAGTAATSTSATSTTP